MDAIAFNAIQFLFGERAKKTLPFLMILLQVKGGHNCFQSNVYSFYSRASVASEKNELVSFSNIWYIHCVLLLPWLQVGARRGRHNCILGNANPFLFSGGRASENI